MSDEFAPGIIDNTQDRQLVGVIKDQVGKSKQAKFAIGYFFLSGFSLVKDDFPSKYEDLPFLKIIMGNETTFPTKEQLALGYRLREEFKQKMIEELQQKELDEKQIEQLKDLKDLVSNNIVDVKLYDKSKLHAKLYLFLTNPEEKFGSPGLGVVGSSNLTAEGITRNKELNVLLSSREEVVYLDKWFDDLWNEAIEFSEDLLKVIDYSGVLPESPYPPMGKFIEPQTLFKYLVYRWFEGRVVNLLKRDVLMEFQLVGVINAINALSHYYGVILADSVGLGKSFIAAAVIEEFLNKKHMDWLVTKDKEPSVMLILPPSIISQWEDILIESGYFFKGNHKDLVHDQDNYKIYDIYDSDERTGRIALLSLGLFQTFKEAKLKDIAEEYDLFIIDEAHRFRNRNTNRHENASKLRKKSDNFPNKFMLLTATPLNNTINDIFNLIRIFVDDTFEPFRIKNIPIDELMKKYRDLKKDLATKDDDNIRKELKKTAAEIKNNVLDESMILRTRKYIKEQFKDIKVDGKPLIFRDPIPHAIDYSPFYVKPYEELISLIKDKTEELSFEYTKLYGSRYVVFESDDEDEEKHYVEIADLFKLLLGKRLESGIFPFETTLRRIYEKEKIFYSNFKDKWESISSKDDIAKVITEAAEKAKIHKELNEALEEYNAEEETEETWLDRLVKILLDLAYEEVSEEKSGIELLKIGLNKILENIERDLRLIDEILEKLNDLKEVKNGSPKALGKIPKDEDIIDLPIYVYKKDPKFEALKQILGEASKKSPALKDVESLTHKRVVIFTQYKDNAYYLYNNLFDWAENEPALHRWLKEAGRVKVGLVTGDTDTPTKLNYLKRFAPEANDGFDEVKKYGGLEILVSTDTLSEGVNLQDADAVVNYDLPWNPMGIVQRVGRVNRIGNEKDVYVLNFIPSSEVEVLVGILSKLKEKISDITLVVGKETKILSPEEDISVETFGEKFKHISSQSMEDLEEYGVSDDFKKFLPEGMPQEQVDEYKLLNFIQYELGMKRDDFKEVFELDKPPYYTFIHSNEDRIVNMNEFHRGHRKVLKKVVTVNPETGALENGSPLDFLNLIRGRSESPKKVDKVVESLKVIKEENDRVVEDFRERYQIEQKGFLYQLFNALYIEKEKATASKEKFKIVMNALQLIPYYLYTRELKPLLVSKNLIEMTGNQVKVKDFQGTVETLYSFFRERGLADIESLKVRVEKPGWFFEVS